jgi:hypothetical protein
MRRSNVLLRGEEEPERHIELAALVVLIVQQTRLVHLFRILVVLQMADER